MRVIQNKIIPFPGFKAINLFGIIFTRSPLNQVDLNHESIHTSQGRELLWVGFYILYFLEWLIKCAIYGTQKAYWNISFEREAFAGENLDTYTQIRTSYAWIKYIRVKKHEDI